MLFCLTGYAHKSYKEKVPPLLTLLYQLSLYIVMCFCAIYLDHPIFFVAYIVMSLKKLLKHENMLWLYCYVGKLSSW